MDLRLDAMDPADICSAALLIGSVRCVWQAWSLAVLLLKATRSYGPLDGRIVLLQAAGHTVLDGN